MGGFSVPAGFDDRGIWSNAAGRALSTIDTNSDVADRSRWSGGAGNRWGSTDRLGGVDDPAVPPHNDFAGAKERRMDRQKFGSSLRLHPFVIRETAMSHTSESTASKAAGCRRSINCSTRSAAMVPMASLVDVRESLRARAGTEPAPGDPCAPTPTTARFRRPACSMNTPCGRGLPVIEVLVFAGRAATWRPPGSTIRRKSLPREAEFRLECSILGTEGVFWDLEGYRMPGYEPTVSDVTKVVEWFETRRPGAVIVPPCNDAHVAHRVTSPIAAIGLVGRANLADCLTLTGWTPWGPLAQPNAYLTYDGEAEPHQGVGYPLSCLAGVLDRLHPSTARTWAAPHVALARKRMERGAQLVRAGPTGPTTGSSASSCSRSSRTTPGR